MRYELGMWLVELVVVTVTGARGETKEPIVGSLPVTVWGFQLAKYQL